MHDYFYNYEKPEELIAVEKIKGPFRRKFYREQQGESVVDQLQSVEYLLCNCRLESKVWNEINIRDLDGSMWQLFKVGLLPKKFFE